MVDHNSPIGVAGTGRCTAQTALVQDAEGTRARARATVASLLRGSVTALIGLLAAALLALYLGLVYMII